MIEFVEPGFLWLDSPLVNNPLSFPSMVKHTFHRRLKMKYLACMMTIIIIYNHHVMSGQGYTHLYSTLLSASINQIYSPGFSWPGAVSLISEHMVGKPVPIVQFVYHPSY